MSIVLREGEDALPLGARLPLPPPQAWLLEQARGTCVLQVSPGYAHEITTPEGGWRMDPLLGDRSFVLSGIINGMRDDEWSPLTDVHLAANYE